MFVATETDAMKAVKTFKLNNDLKLTIRTQRTRELVNNTLQVQAPLFYCIYDGNMDNGHYRG